jgi:hypothetical protein
MDTGSTLDVIVPRIMTSLRLMMWPVSPRYCCLIPAGGTPRATARRARGEVRVTIAGAGKKQLDVGP